MLGSVDPKDHGSLASRIVTLLATSNTVILFSDANVQTIMTAPAYLRRRWRGHIGALLRAFADGFDGQSSGISSRFST